MDVIDEKLAQKPPQFDPWKARKARESLPISQRSLAQRMGMGPRGAEYVCRCESWVLGVTPGRLFAWARALRIARVHLLSDEAGLAESRRQFDAWVAEGRPPVREFVLHNLAQ